MDNLIDSVRNDASLKGELDKSVPIGPRRLRRVLCDMVVYNEYFDGEAIAYRLLPEPLNGKAQYFEQEKDRQVATAATISARHASSLNTIGLDIEAVYGKQVHIASAEGSMPDGELRLNVVAGAKYASFLGSLSPELVESRKEVSSLLSRVSANARDQLRDHYDLDASDSPAVELLGNLGAIVEEYERLGITPGTTSQLRTYLEHVRKKDIREFLPIEKQGLLREPGVGFGPGDWHRDAPLERLGAKWDKALTILRETYKNPNAQELYETLKRHLSYCASNASDSLDSLSYLSEDEIYKRSIVLAEAFFALYDLPTRSEQL